MHAPEGEFFSSKRSGFGLLVARELHRLPRERTAECEETLVIPASVFTHDPVQVGKQRCGFQLRVPLLAGYPLGAAVNAVATSLRSTFA